MTWMTSTPINENLKFSGMVPPTYKDRIFEIKMTVSDGYKEIDSKFTMNFTDSPPYLNKTMSLQS